MKKLVIHPFLFALSPSLFLYSRNMDLAPRIQILRPAIFTVFFALLLLSILSLILKNTKKAGFIVSLFLMLFFVYEKVFDVINSLIPISAIETTKTIVSIFALASFTIFVFLMHKTHKDLIFSTFFFNLTGIFLISMSLFTIVNYSLKSNYRPDLRVSLDDSNHAIDSDSLPNIFYIILDAYARADILNDIYQYDNREFLNFLAAKGFYVARNSRPNYAQTILSLASSLNFKYLNDVAAYVGRESSSRKPLNYMIQNNRVVNYLKNYGYSFVAYTSGYGGMVIQNADINMNSKRKLSEFENMLLNKTPIPDILHIFGLQDQWDTHRGRILDILDSLTATAGIKKPVFVFAHILCPHPPFVFGKDGTKINQKEINPLRYFTFTDGAMPWVGLSKEEYVESYRNQLSFINKRVETTIDAIISNSSVPPVIVLQSDHGPSSELDSGLSNPDSIGVRERMSILNAYYLPDNGSKLLYNEITPVNTFRIIFNKYFNAKLVLLNDESFFSSWDEPYSFVNIKQYKDID